MWGNWSQHVSFLSCSRFNIPRVTWGLLSGWVGFVIGNVSPKPHQSKIALQPAKSVNPTTNHRIRFGRCSLHSVSRRAHDGALFAQVPVLETMPRELQKAARFVKPRPIKRVTSKQCGTRVAERIVVERKGGQTRGAPGPPLPPCHCFVVCGRRRRDDSVRTAGDFRRHARNRACRGGSMRAHRGPPL